MNLFSPSKSDFPEQQQQVELWTTSLDSFKKQIKYLNTFLQDLTSTFESYGKSIQKSGKTLISSLSKSITPNNKNLSECLKACGSYSEVLGCVYQKSSSALSTTITSKILKVTDTATELKKRIAEDTSIAMKELSTAKLNHLKVKVKYEKSKKEYDQLQLNLTKLKDDPNSTYQPIVIQRAAEKAKTVKKEVSALLKSLNDHVTLIHSKSSVLETILFNINAHTVNFEQETVQLIQENLKLLIQMCSDIVGLREEQANSKQERLSGLANITLDMVNSKETETNLNTLENLSCKLDSRVSSCEERLKAIKLFKVFIGEIVTGEESLGKNLEKCMKGFVLPEYFDTKPVIKTFWEGFFNSLVQIYQLHLEQSKEISKKTLENLTNLISSQGNLSKTLQATVQKIIKDHALTHEECLKDYEKLKRTTEEALIQKRSAEISQKMKSSYETTENQVLTSLADNSNVESSHFQILKMTLISMYTAEESFNSSLSNIVMTSEKILKDADVSQDFKGRELYRKKSIPQLASFGDVSHTSESIDDEDEEALNADALLQKCGLKSGTTLIDSYSCALSQKLLLQGRLYITTTHICFHSYFNSTTIFGRETLVSIPLIDILKVEKRSVLFFENSLGICTKFGNFLFTSFYYREQAFATLENLLRLNNPIAVQHGLNCVVLIELRKWRLDIRKNLLSVKDEGGKCRVLESVLKYKVLDEPLKLAARPQKVFELLFSDMAQGFLKEYLEVQGNLEIVVGNWTPGVPKFFENGEGEDFVGVSERTADFMHPVKDRLPFMPKYCRCHELHSIFFVGKDEFVVEHEVSVSGVPLSDCFVAYMQYSVKGTDEESEIDIRYGVQFLKSTVFRGKIEDSGVNQSKRSTVNVWVPKAINKIQQLSGKVVQCAPVQIAETPPKAIFKWNTAGFVILALFTLYLWMKVLALQSQLDELVLLVNSNSLQ